jgi:hypothetical protein
MPAQRAPLPRHIRARSPGGNRRDVPRATPSQLEQSAGFTVAPHARRKPRGLAGRTVTPGPETRSIPAMAFEQTGLAAAGRDQPGPPRCVTGGPRRSSRARARGPPRSWTDATCVGGGPKPATVWGDAMTRRNRPSASNRSDQSAADDSTTAVMPRPPELRDASAVPSEATVPREGTVSRGPIRARRRLRRRRTSRFVHLWTRFGCEPRERPAGPAYSDRASSCPPLAAPQAITDLRGLDPPRPSHRLGRGRATSGPRAGRPPAAGTILPHPFANGRGARLAQRLAKIPYRCGLYRRVGALEATVAAAATLSAG